MKIFDGTRIPLLSKALQAYSKRNNVISSNIANIATPGYRVQRVVFEEKLSNAMEGTSLSGMQTSEKHLPIGAPSMAESSSQIIETEEPLGGEPLASGVNNVDIDKEMAEMAKNQIRFRFAARMISDTFKGIQKSIRGQG